MRILIPLIVALLFSYTLYSQSEISKYSASRSDWAESIMSKMSVEEKIGQLIMVTSYPSNGSANESQIIKWIEEQKVGGVLFLKTTPLVLASCTQKYQAKSGIPLFIALDAENGLSFRLDSVVRYPHTMGLGSITDNSLIYQMGREIGQQCKMLGVNLNFAPVADVNSNPNNPIINYRSFGENVENVAQKTWQLAKGMQDEKILVTAKHFPGHGDTHYDSHLVMPSINKNYKELTDVDFVPFRKCIESGINGIMTAHINMSGIEKSNRPATLSPYVMTTLLRDSLKFDGLIFSDGMNMAGITKYFSEGEAAVEAIKAGVDVIEFVLNPDVVIKAIRAAVVSGEIDIETINKKCKKVIIAKDWLGLFKKTEVHLDYLYERLNGAQYRLTANKLYQKSITLIINNDSILPLARLDTLRIASVSIGEKSETYFQRRLEKYMDVDHFFIDLASSDAELHKTMKQLKAYNLIIVGIHDTRLSSSNQFNVQANHKKAISLIVNQHKTIVSFFGNPYALNYIPDIEKSEALLITYGDNYWSQDYTAQLIFGAIGANSKLPVSINKNFDMGAGFEVKKNGRLKYSIPEEEGFDSNLLKSKIDSFANLGINQEIFPGCQVLVAKNGNVIFHESYGYHTYDKSTHVDNSNLYDWASVTKITGPLPLIMKMYEDSILKLDVPFSKYWSDFIGTDKDEITLREILAHQAGFKPWIPFVYASVNPKKGFQKRVVKNRPSINYQKRISSDLYVSNNFKCSLFSEIAALEISKKKTYQYSDIAFYLFPDLITDYIGLDYETCLMRSFLSPLGASSVNYNPYRFYSKSAFVPTEQDDLFRKELLQGFVHDEGAALMGGISGNAGLFGNTNDLAKIMQFYLQEGCFGDYRFIQPETIKEFTRVQFPENENRRGLGFDKPYLDNKKKKLADTYPAKAVSNKSFGHSGFTGIFTWADPHNQLLFIFMSNRIFPTRDNKKIITLNFRPELQQAVYNCEGSFEPARY